MSPAANFVYYPIELPPGSGEAVRAPWWGFRHHIFTDNASLLEPAKALRKRGGVTAPNFAAEFVKAFWPNKQLANDE